jgi:RND family efflux transporter MFP subunit
MNRNNVKLGTCLLFVLALTSCSENQVQTEPTPQLRPVKTMILTSASNSHIHEFTAVVDASRKADLSFKLSGELTEFLVKQGDSVKKGDVIARLDKTDILIQVKEAQSSLDKAKADYDRAKNLIKTDYISKADFDKLKAIFNSAQAALDSNNNKLRYTELIASFDGTIAKTYTERFQEIKAKTPIVRLHDASQIKLIVNIPESIMIRVKKDSDTGDISAVFNSIPEKTFPIKFSEVTTLADEQTKTYQVTFLLNAPKAYTILPGMTAVVSAKINTNTGAEPAFYLPANIVLKDKDGNYVYVVTKASAGKGKVSRKNIVIGDITTSGIEVYKGLVASDVVITAGMSKISDGMLVKL